MLVGLVMLAVDAGTTSLAEIVADPPRRSARHRRDHARPRRRAVEVGDRAVPLLAARRHGRADPGERLPARRGHGEGRHLPRSPRLAPASPTRPAGARCSSASACCTMLRRRLARPAAARPEARCSPTARSASSASSPSSSASAPATPRSPGSRCSLGARALQVDAVPRRRHHRPPHRHPRPAQAERARPAEPRCSPSSPPLAARSRWSGLPPLLGFVAKEAVFTALLEAATAGGTVGLVALVGVAVGSVLTVAYSARFLWGAFARKPGVPRPTRACTSTSTSWSRRPPWLAGRPRARLRWRPSSATRSSGYSPTASPVACAGQDDYHLALWHGLEPALGISRGHPRASGSRCSPCAAASPAAQNRVPTADRRGRGYWRVMRLIDRTAARRHREPTQRGSLPFYLGVILARARRSRSAPRSRSTELADRVRRSGTTRRSSPSPSS